MKMPKYYYFRVRVINKGTGVEVEDASDVDVVEVVRCKDCAWCKVCDYGEEKYFICDYDCGLYGDVDPDGFCYRGIERDEID